MTASESDFKNAHMAVSTSGFNDSSVRMMACVQKISIRGQRLWKVTSAQPARIIPKMMGRWEDGGGGEGGIYEIHSRHESALGYRPRRPVHDESEALLMRPRNASPPEYRWKTGTPRAEGSFGDSTSSPDADHRRYPKYCPADTDPAAKTTASLLASTLPCKHEDETFVIRLVVNSQRGRCLFKKSVICKNTNKMKLLVHFFDQRLKPAKCWRIRIRFPIDFIRIDSYRSF